MQAKVTYDGHPNGWCLTVVADTEAEAAVLSTLVKLTNNGVTLKIVHARTDFTDPEMIQRQRIFLVELHEGTDDKNAVGFRAPEREREVAEDDPVAACRQEAAA